MDALDLTSVTFDALPGWRDQAAEAWAPFLSSCRALLADAPELRKGRAPTPRQREVAARAVEAGPLAPAAAFFQAHFDAYAIGALDADPAPAFFTAYYRPEVEAALAPSAAFSEPLLARPDDLVTLQPGEALAGLEGLAAARRRADGTLEPYPARAAIEAGALRPAPRAVAYVADAIEAFMIHVQGSARLVLPDGSKLDLTYAGRNGRPYTSIGRVLVESGAIPQADMSLARLKSWVRAQGQRPGQEGRLLLHRNESFVFFAAAPADPDLPGPIGAAGLPLTPGRSIAIDRTLWPYGLPFFVQADLPDENGRIAPYARLMIAQDTGSAIVGPARADLYFGSGAAAGAWAGEIRHRGRLFAFLPKERS